MLIHIIGITVVLGIMGVFGYGIWWCCKYSGEWSGDLND
jgi:hypothetical protein